MRPPTTAQAATTYGSVLAIALFALQPAAQNVASSTTDPAANKKRIAFPVNMLRVPGGKVTLGTTAKDLLEVTKDLEPRATRRRQKLMQKLASELGEETVEVAPFYLDRYLVTNEQYLKFVQANQGKVRFPFHWWKEGKPDNWAKTQAKAREAFKGQKRPDLLYWEAYWDKLPYAIPEGQEKLPVVFVSWRDAQRFAGWAGMRLPTEAEWMLAARGEQSHRFLWGDEWQDDMLKKLELDRSTNKRLKPVGALGALARGPFGNEDMVGNCWEWMADVGFFPVAGQDSFKKEFAKVRRNKLFTDLPEPDWNGSKRVLKGASFFSWQDKSEFRIGTRAYAADFQTVEGVGFRLAKSDIPARDMCKSRLTVEYDSSFFGGEREPDIDRQIGMERYDLANDGTLITNYHALAVVPVNHMGIEHRMPVAKLEEASEERPMVIGTLVTTEPIAEPKLDLGIYTIYYRHKGMPDELRKALDEGSRILMAAAIAKKAGKKPKEEPESKGKGPTWRQILAKYGITEEEATRPKAHTKIKLVRLKPGNLEVPIDKNVFVFRGNSAQNGPGAFVSFMPDMDGNQLGKKNGYKDESLKLRAGAANQILVFSFGAPWSSKTTTKKMGFKLTLKLPEAPDLTRRWIVPEDTVIEGPTGNGNPTARTISEHGK